MTMRPLASSWEQRKLGEIAPVTMGQSPNGACYTDNPNDVVLVQGNADLKDGWVSPRVWTTEITKTAKSGDLIMSVRAPVGAMGKTAYDVVLGRGVAGIVGNEFLFQALSKKEAEGYWSTVSAGSTFDSINGDELRSTPIDCPRSETECEAIGNCLSKVDYLITLHQRKYDKLCAVKKSMLDKMFPKPGETEPEIRFAGFTDPWEQRKLGNCGTTYSGLSGKTKEDFGHGSARFVPYTNVFDNPLTDTKRLEAVEIDSSQNKIAYGDVFFTVSSETPDEVGMSSVWLSDQEDVYLNSFCFGYRQDSTFDSHYLAYMLRSSSIRSNLALLAQGISRFNISKNKVMELSVPVPSAVEQKQIGQYFARLDNLITLHQRELNLLKNTKKSLLDKMFV